MRIYRRIALDSYAKITQSLPAFKRNRLDDVAAALLWQRLYSIPQSFKDCRSKNRRLDGLHHDMRCQKQTLVKFTRRVAQRRAHLAAKARGSKAVGCVFDKVRTADDVTAGRGKTAAQVFNQRAGHQIGTHLGRLLLFDKFAVAIIHKADNVGVGLLGSLADAADFGNIDSFAHAAVAAGALNVDHGGFACDSLLERYKVHMVTRHGQLLVAHTQIHQRAGCFYRIAYDSLHSVVRCACYSHQLVTCAQIAQKRHRQGVRTAYKLRAHQCRLRMEQLCVNRIQLVTAHVAIAIAGGRL